MNNSELDFLKYINSIEKMMVTWHDYSYEALKHSVNLGGAREHFIKEILANFLPKNVVVGSGEITDGKHRSGQQDVIIYRSDFPVLSGFGSVNTYLIEGVIATIEVKSDLSTGSPNGLYTAFRNVATVTALTNQAIALSGNPKQIEELQRALTVKTYIVGYKGWESKEALLENYRIAANAAGWNNLPHLVYQPNGCVVTNTPISNLHKANKQSVPVQETQIAFCSEHPFAIFFQHLLKAIITTTGGLTANAFGNEAKILYDLNNYFSLPDIPCVSIQLLRDKA
jgi:hypothetical protein